MFRKKGAGCLSRIILTVLLVAGAVLVIKNWDAVLTYAQTFAKANQGQYQLSWQAPAIASDNQLDKPANGTFGGNGFLVNTQYPLPQDYVPQGLVNVYEKRQKGLIGLANTEIQLTEQTLDALQTMLIDAKAEGVSGMILTSGYRSISRQQEIFDQRVQSFMDKGNTQEQAVTATRQSVQLPGSSEHHTGLALDVTADGATPDENGNNDSFALTLQGRWLSKNAWQYGFILRYQKGKEQITGVRAEPWHLRYVGQPHAEIMQHENLSLEEYTQKLAQTGGAQGTTWDGRSFKIVHTQGEGVTIPAPAGAVLDGDGMGGYWITLLSN